MVSYGLLTGAPCRFTNWTPSLLGAPPGDDPLDVDLAIFSSLFCLGTWKCVVKSGNHGIFMGKSPTSMTQWEHLWWNGRKNMGTHGEHHVFQHLNQHLNDTNQPQHIIIGKSSILRRFCSGSLARGAFLYSFENLKEPLLGSEWSFWCLVVSTSQPLNLSTWVRLVRSSEWHWNENKNSRVQTTKHVETNVIFHLYYITIYNISIAHTMKFPIKKNSAHPR